MRATVSYGAGDIRVVDVPDPVVQAPTDVVVRVTHSCICGSDLWPYKKEPVNPGRATGHEFIGVVEEVGAEVATLSRGDWVIAPFVDSDGTCANCRRGLHTSCENGGAWGNGVLGGAQSEAVRVPYADGTLVAIPAGAPAELAPALLALSDVMGTGHHAAVSAGVTVGSTVAVVGDGAVGLCGVLAARRLGAERVILLGRNESRWKVAQGFGATDQVTERDEAAVERVRELTDGGADAVLECVGTGQALKTAVGAARAGGRVGFVGVPQELDAVPLREMFSRNVGLNGGVAPVRAYIPDLLADVLQGRIDPSPVFDARLPLAAAPDGYRAMNERTAIKVLLEP